MRMRQTDRERGGDFSAVTAKYKIRLSARLVRLSDDKAINPKLSDKIRHFGSTAYIAFNTVKRACSKTLRQQVCYATSYLDEIHFIL